MDKKYIQSNKNRHSHAFVILFISMCVFLMGASWDDSFYENPVKVAQAFIDAVVSGKKHKINSYLVKGLHNNNHWVNATKYERKNIFAHWIPVEFRKKNKNFGYVIIEAPYGNIAVKFIKTDGKWLWANE